MGKYSKLKKDMVKFEQPSDWQHEIDEVKLTLRPMNNAGVGQYFSEVKDQKSDLEAQIRECNTKLEAATQILVERLEDEGISSFKLENGTSIYIKDEPYCSAQDKNAFHAWIREQGMDDLFSVHYQTLAGMVKERLTAGEELPPGIAVFMKSSIQRRTAKQ